MRVCLYRAKKYQLGPKNDNDACHLNFRELICDQAIARLQIGQAKFDTAHLTKFANALNGLNFPSTCIVMMVIMFYSYHYHVYPTHK